jgi:hypothetical protein
MELVTWLVGEQLAYVGPGGLRPTPRCVEAASGLS